ncbi:hypothetical protein TREES_T100017552 [Tupaia chinensis]|uniref:Uncharacterized protein n=1 Tax=Tupaia chinensis TaxID=246437 RepID=L9LBB5_TUPCH|nr:hypothetical protein TREES_T100017552 [Tupaia chinensis]
MPPPGRHLRVPLLLPLCPESVINTLTPWKENPSCPVLAPPPSTMCERHGWEDAKQNRTPEKQPIYMKNTVDLETTEEEEEARKITGPDISILVVGPDTSRCTTALDPPAAGTYRRGLTPDLRRAGRRGGSCCSRKAVCMKNTTAKDSLEREETNPFASLAFSRYPLLFLLRQTSSCHVHVQGVN